jgi:predicted MFS family arabinose efflux permease
MLAVGAATGGVVAGTLGIHTAFVIDGFTFLLSAAFIARIRMPKASRAHDHDRTVQGVLSEYLEGVRLLRDNKDVLLISLHKAMLMLSFGSTFQVVLVTVAEQVFVVGEGGSLGVGLLLAALGIGTGISPLIVRRFTGDREYLLRPAILCGYLTGAAGLVLVSLLKSLPVVLAASTIVGCGSGLLWVFSTQLLLRAAPSEIRGRVFASEFAFFTLASATGAALVGFALDQSVGIPVVLRWMAGLSLLPASVWGLWTLIWSFRKGRD